MSTHNICFGREIRKKNSNPLLSGGLNYTTQFYYVSGFSHLISVRDEAVLKDARLQKPERLNVLVCRDSNFKVMACLVSVCRLLREIARPLGLHYNHYVSPSVQLVKILINLEPYDKHWIKLCILIYLNIVQPLVCKTVTRLCRGFFAKHSHRFAYLSWRSLVTVLYTSVSIMLKCIRTRLLKHSVWLPEHCLQFKGAVT